LVCTVLDPTAEPYGNRNCQVTVAMSSSVQPAVASQAVAITAKVRHTSGRGSQPPARETLHI
jgi:hypothetical protein